MERTGMNDIKSYIKRYHRIILMSAAAQILCFGVLALGTEIRIDTEELINQPGTTLGWLTIGRYGLVLLKRLLGLGTHSAFKSGLLFLLFFIAGTELLGFFFYYFSGKKEKYPYGVFLFLYGTSNIWSYQVYFSLQQAEIALAMLLLIISAFLSVRACFLFRGRGNLLRLVASAVLLVVGLGAYQALAAYYIAVCIGMFLLLMENETFADNAIRLEDNLEAEHKRNRKWAAGIAELIFHFGISYLIYDWIADTWFMAAGEYMGDQMGWGRLSVLECIKNVLRTAKNLLLGIGPRNFSFYAIGILLALALLLLRWRQKRYRTRQGLLLYALALAGLIASPLLMTAYMGEMLVARSQFALPVAAAFLGMYTLGGFAEFPEVKTWMRRGCLAAIAAVAVVQGGYNLRQAHVDRVRYEQDISLTEDILTALKDVNGGALPQQPVLFVGYHKAELSGFDRRTEMYGWSFYEWDYSAANPTGATHRIAGFIQAYSRNVLNEAATEEQKAASVRLAEKMPAFPAKGSVLAGEDFVVVKLSEVTERTDVDFW